jgi:hypothetical protein
VLFYPNFIGHSLVKPVKDVVAMKTCKTILTTAIFLLLLIGNGIVADMKAQSNLENFLEQVGGSEVELMMFLKGGENKDAVTRNGALIGIEGKDQGATYTIQRGLVVHVNFQQSFPTEEAAQAAFDNAKSFLEERGVEMQVMRGQNHYHLMTGEGNGLRSTLVTTSGGSQYRLNAEVIAIR